MPFGDRCVEIRLSSSSVQISGDSFKVEFRERAVVVEGSRDVSLHSIRGGKRKVVYIWLHSSNGVPCRNEVAKEFESMLVHVKCIELATGNYLNIVLAGSFLVDYAVLSEGVLALVIPGKREVYVDRAGSAVTIYLV